MSSDNPELIRLTLTDTEYHGGLPHRAPDFPAGVEDPEKPGIFQFEVTEDQLGLMIAEAAARKKRALQARDRLGTDDPRNQFVRLETEDINKFAALEAKLAGYRPAPEEN